MRVVGILAAYNEEPVIRACMEHHIAQGIELYLIDNGSTDRTVAIAQNFLGQGLIGIETIPRKGTFDLSRLLLRKQELAQLLEADWFIHLDADEMRLPPDQSQTLAETIKEVDKAGYNAINFLEFTFVPTVEAPDHAHADFPKTMRWYYPFLPRSLHRVNGWKKQPQPVDLVTKAGHWVAFPKQFIYPIPFRMRHYQFLSIEHAIQKYAPRRHPVDALMQGMHGWREQLDPTSIRLPSQAALHTLGDDGWLDYTNPRAKHILDNRSEYGMRSAATTKSVDEHLRRTL
jgi:glycosyltransferase involved in cell wall biosynthesis